MVSKKATTDVLCCQSIAPALRTNGTVTGVGLRCKGWDELFVTIPLGATDGTLTVTLEHADEDADGTPGTFAAAPVAYNPAVLSATDDAKASAISIDLGNAIDLKAWIRAKAVVAASTTGAAYCVWFELRKPKTGADVVTGTTERTAANDSGGELPIPVVQAA